jgi:hypothetical protein
MIKPIWTALVQVIGHLDLITSPDKISYRKRLVFYWRNGHENIWMAIGAASAQFILRMLALYEKGDFKYSLSEPRQKKEGGPNLYYTIYEEGVVYTPGTGLYLQRRQTDDSSKLYYSIGGNKKNVIRFFKTVREQSDKVLKKLQEEQRLKRINRQRRCTNG